jgi:hypothetical protein
LPNEDLQTKIPNKDLTALSNEIVLSCCEACAWAESILDEIAIADYVTNADIETKILAGTP